MLIQFQHYAIKCNYQDRGSTIGDIVQVYSGSHGRAMVFCQTKKDADELACSSAIKQDTHVLHGDIPQAKREIVLKVRLIYIVDFFMKRQIKTGHIY
jgi:ATP-dependent RNA helicase DDX21